MQSSVFSGVEIRDDEVVRKEPEAAPAPLARAGGSSCREKPWTSIPQHRDCKSLLSLECEESKSHFHLSEKSFAA